jgi:hypothetical protein
MSFFKIFELESGHEVLILKNYNSDKDCHVTQMFVDDRQEIQTAEVSFTTKEARDDMFNKYSHKDAQSFADFMIN